MTASKQGIINRILGRTGVTTKLDYLQADSVKIGNGEEITTYDEGFWTPDYASASGSHALTGRSGGGSYVRIGNIVNCWGNVYYTGGNAGTASGQLYLIGLPFTVKFGAGYYAAIAALSMGWPSTNSPRGGIVLYNDTRISLMTLASADGRDNMSAIVNGTSLYAYAQVYLTASYFCA
jgi:hypothetical protein